MKLEPRVLRPALSMLLSVLITASVGRALVPWSIVEVNEQEDSFEKLFSNIQAGCFDSVTVSDDLNNATLQRSFVGNKTDALMVTSNRQSVLNVCSEFGKYVKLSVELSCDRPEPIPLLANAFAVMNVLFSDLDLTGRLKNVCVRDHACKDPIEKLYYSCDFEPICCQCASADVSSDNEYLPLCQQCKEQGISRTRRPQRSNV